MAGNDTQAPASPKTVGAALATMSGANGTLPPSAYETKKKDLSGAPSGASYIETK